MGNVRKLPRFYEGMLVLIFLWELEDPEILEDPRALEELTVEAVLRIRMTPEGDPVSRLIPPGASGWQCLKESHASYHSWPEDGALVFEIYSCRAFPPENLIDWLRNRVKTRAFHWEMLGGSSGFFRPRFRRGG